MSRSRPAMPASEEIRKMEKLIERARAQSEEMRRGLRGILDELEMDSARFLEPRGHWPIPGGSDEADKYRMDYYDSGAVSSEPDDGSPRISDVLDLVVGIRTNRELLDDGTAARDINYYGYWFVNFGRKIERLALGPAKKLALSASRSKKGGVKGNRSPWRLEPIRERNESMVLAARKLLAAGYERHNLASWFHRRYKDDHGFPSSLRQYREILKGLDK